MHPSSSCTMLGLPPAAWNALSSQCFLMAQPLHPQAQEPQRGNRELLRWFPWNRSWSHLWNQQGSL